MDNSSASTTLESLLLSISGRRREISCYDYYSIIVHTECSLFSCQKGARLCRHDTKHLVLLRHAESHGSRRVYQRLTRTVRRCSDSQMVPGQCGSSCFSSPQVQLKVRVLDKSVAATPRTPVAMAGWTALSEALVSPRFQLSRPQ